MVPADERPGTPPFDPGPAMIALGAVGSLGHAWPAMDAVPLPVALCLTGAGLLTGRWAHGRILARGAGAHGVVLAASLGFGALDAVVSTVFVGNQTAGGWPACRTCTSCCSPGRWR